MRSAAFSCPAFRSSVSRAHILALLTLALALAPPTHAAPCVIKFATRIIVGLGVVKVRAGVAPLALFSIAHVEANATAIFSNGSGARLFAIVNLKLAIVLFSAAIHRPDAARSHCSHESLRASIRLFNLKQQAVQQFH